jgi:hypothetical protein
MGGPYAARLIRLNCLAPDIVASILNGKQPADLTANKLIADTRLPLDWRARVCLTASSPPQTINTNRRRKCGGRIPLLSQPALRASQRRPYRQKSTLRLEHPKPPAMP